MILSGLGVLAAALALAFTPLLVHTLQMPAALNGEARLCFYILGLCIPFVIVAAGLRGFLEAFQRFDLVNAVRLPSGALMYARARCWRSRSPMAFPPW